MIVPIVRDGKLQEWAIIELQGNLEFHYKNKCFVGDLHYEKNDTPVLIIGMHILHGKEAMLPKPLAILEKRKDEDDNTEYAVKAIVKKKLVFKGRPKPIVAGIIKN
ncbi:chromosome transmission fidelity protein 8 homolog isoform X1 [Cotesia glomerata]|uniref:chromosome transmission fidelity protein 8 homolog isoform X1 n=1 Tax=Cotesia glomerata TaxID=32391 RepID=UPI001D035759|nr:chromosome transmission fidelity protein 8 homolog isoform X1 [Cotesia glomerata]